MGPKSLILCVVAAVMMIVARRTLATCNPCPEHVYPNGTVQYICGTPPSCQYGVTKSLCSCCLNKCNKGPYEECYVNMRTTRWREGCVAGFKCRVPNIEDRSYESNGLCVPEASQDPCSPGLDFFKHKHVHDGSNSVLTIESAKSITRSKGSLWRQYTYGEINPATGGRLPVYDNTNTVYDGRNITYHLHPNGESCYTNFVKSFRCLDASNKRYFSRNITCGSDGEGPYCAALFSKDSGVYEGDICRATPELGNTVHPLATNCSSPWFLVDNQCFLRVAENRTWDSASSYCSAKAPGAGLAQPNNIKALTAHLNITDNGYNEVLWLGGSDFGSEGSWYWINGATNITTGWQANQPDNDRTVNKDGQDCLTMWTGRGPGSNILADTNCDDTWNFLCQQYSYEHPLINKHTHVLT